MLDDKKKKADASCPEHRRVWFWLCLCIGTFLFCTNLAVLMNLAKQHSARELRVSSTADSALVIPNKMATITSADTEADNGLPRRLPADFRYAHICPAAEQKLTNFAPRSEKPKVPSENRKEFVMGGYQKIHKGSGDYRLVGPMTMKLSNVQHDEGIFGSVAELGVHHGRFTGALYITAKETEKLLAADLFEELQSQNVDVSGYGDKQAFLAGLQSYGLDETDLHLLYTGSTEDIPFDWHLRKNFEPFRLISVDAGHTAALTFNDLEVAFCNTLRGGIVILDDFFHNLWPGVTEGFFQFAAMGPVKSVYPFLRCEGKNFVTNDRRFHQLYYNKLKNDPTLKVFLKEYAHNTRGTKVKYMMNGVEYLKCNPESLTEETFHMLWNFFTTS